MVGCTNNGSDEQTKSPGCDVSVNSVSLSGEGPYFMGGTIPIQVSLSSDTDSEYTVSVRINNRVVYTENLVSNYSGTLNIPAKYSGTNATLSVRATPLRCIDTRATNNVKSTNVTILPIANFHSISLNDSQRVFKDRMIATKLNLPGEVYLQSIGFYLRSDLVLNSNASLVFYLYNDSENHPGAPILNLTTQLLKISDKWNLVILNSKEPVKLNPGNYWLGVWLDDEAYANVLCFEDDNNSTLSSRVIMGDPGEWNPTNCTPYFVLGSGNALETYGGLKQILNS